MGNRLVDLASEAGGGEVVFANDEFFAAAERLIHPAEPEWREGVYTNRGKWMDGWESRRRRQPGHDWCVVRLGIAGVVVRVIVDTTHFKGNAPEAFGLDGSGAAPGTAREDLAAAEFPWSPLVDRAELRPDHRNEFDVTSDRRVTHMRLRIYPDGGVARLRVLGTPLPALPDVAPDDALPDLASTVLGGEIEAVSDEFFSSPEQVLRPSPSTGMHDGWETRRRRGDGHDWLVVRLGLPGTPASVLVDTTHFKGNAPGWISVDAAAADDDWTEIIPRRPVAPNRHHLVEAQASRAATRIRLNLYPDGGIARLRVYGRPDSDALEAIRLAYLNRLYDDEARRLFGVACRVGRFIDSMMAARPLADGRAVLDAAEGAFAALEEPDWLEAFASHPRIGERTRHPWAAREQAGTAGAPAEILEALAEGNARYEERFGFPFIVFASGRSAGEVLAALHERLAHDRPEELTRAAAEQRRIAALRLRHMLCIAGEET
ncbi:MAG: allantoicase [Acidimicrobiales bacterium]